MRERAKLVLVVVLVVGGKTLYFQIYVRMNGINCCTFEDGCKNAVPSIFNYD